MGFWTRSDPIVAEESLVLELGSVILLAFPAAAGFVQSPLVSEKLLPPLGDKSLLKPQHRETISHIEISQDIEKTHILIKEFSQF